MFPGSLTLPVMILSFTSTPILTHWIPNIQLIMETKTLDYALTTILSIVNVNEEMKFI